MTIVFPENTRDIINQIRYAIGRNVTFVVISDSEICYVCGLDPVTNSAVDPYCPVCSGLGYLYTYSGVTVSGHVTWGFSELLAWYTGGQQFEGDCRVQVEFVPEVITIIDTAKWVIVDGKTMQIKKRIYRGVKELNRVLYDLIEVEK